MAFVINSGKGFIAPVIDGKCQVVENLDDAAISQWFEHANELCHRLNFPLCIVHLDESEDLLSSCCQLCGSTENLKIFPSAQDNLFDMCVCRQCFENLPDF